MNTPESTIPTQAKKSGRRGFFQALAGAGTGAVTGLAGFQLLNSPAAEAAEVPPPLADSASRLTIRMQQDLEQTLSSGRTPSWLMVVDTRKCVGCNACTVACRAENVTGPAGNFRKVVKTDLPIGARPWAIYKPSNCLQCDDAPCARAVPKGWVVQRPDGIVEIDHERVRGPYARAVAQACPLKLVHIDDGKTFTQDTPVPQAYESRSFMENGRLYRRTPGGNQLAEAARKCTFCSHLLDVGVLPACVTTCIGGAMYFGDANNSNSLITEITKGRRVFKGHENRGLKPRVIYFTESIPGTPHVECAACHS